MSCGHNFSLKQRPTLVAPSRYLKHVRRAHRKFSRFFQKKFNLKTCEFVRIFQLDFELHFFSKSHFFYCSLHIHWLVCHAVTIFFQLTQRSRLGGPFRYLENVHKAHRKFSRDFWKKVSTQNMRNKWSTQGVWNMLTKPHILSWNFSKVSGKLSVDFMNLFKVSERSA